MNFVIITEYPLWFLVFCILLGAAVSALLYVRNSKYNLTFVLKNLLAVIRFVAITLIAFLLLSPLVKTVSRNIEKPIIIIAQDNSESILINKDSAYYKNQYKEQLKKFIDELASRYEVKTYSFGDKVKESSAFDFADKITDISSFFDELQTRYSNRNVGALVIATDGLYNKGQNPLYASGFASFPIYTMALGDTTIYRDLLINKINYNRTAFLGNKFPVEVIVTANKCKGSNSVLKVSSGNYELFSKELSFVSNFSTQNVLLEVDAKQVGLQHYHVVLTPIKGEVTEANNAQDFYVDVVDQRQKILILSNSPNPDIAAFKESLEKNDNYEVESSLASEFTKSFSGYSLIILHQLPSTTDNASRIIAAINKSNVPVIYILGAQTDFNTFNSLKAGISIVANTKTSMNEALPVVNNDFPLFTIDEDLKHLSDDLPPLYSPYGTYKTSNSANVLFYQKIGSVATKQPLIIFNQQDREKSCVIAGEGIWRWKLFDFVQHQNHDIFNSFLGKIIQYLAAAEDNSLFRVSGNNNFYENENVEFNAEVYNESYELINKPDVNFTIFNKENKKYTFEFSKTSNAYHLDAGIFPVGEYRYQANVKVGEKVFTKNGFFNVLALNIEFLNTTADHKMLFSLAHKHDGKLFYPNQF
ncbi:MAG: hypothetical protein ABR968_14605, partial [Bacteroidales bacterium]